MLDINEPKYTLLDEYEIELLDPKSATPCGAKVTLIAPRLPEFKRAHEAEKNAAPEGEDHRIAAVIAGIKSWDGFNAKDKAAPCTNEAKRAFFGNANNVGYMAQVHAVLSQTSTFLAPASES